MKEHIKKVLFILALSSIIFYTKLSEPYLIVLTFLAALLNPIYAISLVPAAYFNLSTEFFYYYLGAILLINLTIFLKNIAYRKLLLFVISVSLETIFYLFSLDLVNLLATVSILTFLIILLFLPFFKDNYLDKLIYTPIFYGIALAMLYYTDTRIMPSLILASTITSPIGFVLLPILILFQGIKPSYLTLLLLVIPSLNFHKKIYPFLAFLLLLGCFFYILYPYYLLSLIYPVVMSLINSKKKLYSKTILTTTKTTS